MLFLTLPFIFSLSYGQQICANGASIGPDLGGCQPGTISVDGQCCPVESVVNIGATNSATSQTLLTSSTGLTTGVASSVCMDKINLNTGTSDCPRLAYLCFDANYNTLMSTNCPRTCGKCPGASTISTKCVDQINPKTGISDCPNRVNLCTNALYQNFMKSQCPKSCGYCGSSSTVTSLFSSTSHSTCVDQINPKTGVSDCPNVREYCNKSQYASLMRTQCPLTCGLCLG